MTSYLRRALNWMNGEEPAPPQPIHLEPHTLAGFCNQADHLEEVLGHTDWQDDAALEARRESIELAHRLAPRNPTLAMRCLKMTASSTNIWGNHNEPLCHMGIQIAHELETTHPATALRFAFAGMSMAYPGSHQQPVAFALVCALLPKATQEDATVAQEVMDKLPHETNGLVEQAMARAAISRTKSLMQMA